MIEASFVETADLAYKRHWRSTRAESPAMSSEIMNRFLEVIEADLRSRPSPIEFEMAYRLQMRWLDSEKPV